MPKPYSMELRTRVVEASEAGEGTFRELAERFKVGEATVNRWVSLKRRTGSVEPSPMGGANRPRLVDAAGEALLRDLLDNNADCTLLELGEAYLEARGVRVSSQTMSSTVRRLGYTRKKGSSAGGRPGGRTWSPRGKRS
jgi:transposase